ncbi:hypothetical protein FWH09_01050 [Candidatus Saccharibacteria bacterium]|nr:hypothetical protein [Candidatus Saccharibacteria bacterium]
MNGNGQTRELVPTIMTKSVEEYKARWGAYYPFASRVQIDVAEAGFAAEPSLPLQDILNAGGWPTDRQVDLHIMSANPSMYTQTIIQRRPHLAIFHVEVGQDLTNDLQQIRAAGIKVGIAFLKPTYPKDYEALLNEVDHALIFNGNQQDLGKHNLSADSHLLLLEKAGLIRSINPAIEIGWDGGVNLENIHQIAISGVNVLNVGGAISGAQDPRAAFEELNAEMNRPEVI